MVNKKYPSQEFLYVLLFHIVAPHCKIMEMKTATPRILPHFPTTSELFLLKMMRQWDISIIDTPNIHCVKRVHIRSYSGPHFSHIFPHSDWIRRDTELTGILNQQPYHSDFHMLPGEVQQNWQQLVNHQVPLIGLNIDKCGLNVKEICLNQGLIAMKLYLLWRKRTAMC